jgi:hypothetical protein
MKKNLSSVVAAAVLPAVYLPGGDFWDLILRLA